MQHVLLYARVMKYIYSTLFTT